MAGPIVFLVDVDPRAVRSAVSRYLWKWPLKDWQAVDGRVRLSSLRTILDHWRPTEDNDGQPSITIVARESFRDGPVNPYDTECLPTWRKTGEREIGILELEQHTGGRWEVTARAYGSGEYGSAALDEAAAQLVRSVAEHLAGQAEQIEPRPEQPPSEGEGATRPRLEDSDRWPFIVEKIAEYEGWLHQGLDQEAAARKVKRADGRPIHRNTLNTWRDRVEAQRKGGGIAAS